MLNGCSSRRTEQHFSSGVGSKLYRIGSVMLDECYSRRME